MKGTKKVKKQTYEGIKITVGIDAHLRQWNVAIYVAGRYYKTFQQEPSADRLHEYLEEHFPAGTYESGYEAGYFGYVAHRRLQVLGIANRVLNASDIPTSDKDKRRKSDQIDAKKIANCVLEDKLKGIYVPSEQQEADRHLVRYRTKVVRKELTRSKQRLKSFLVSKGKHIEVAGYTNSYWSKSMLKQVEQLEFDYASDKVVLDYLLSDLAQAQTRLYQLNRQLVLLSKTKRYEALVTRLRSIPGIGLITAMTLVTEIGDMRRFKSLDKLSSYVGIIPDVAGSDKKQIVKGLTYRSNKELRRLLIQSSWLASSRDLTFINLYQRQLHSNGKIAQKAIIKVARKLLSIIRAIWLKEENYQAAYKQAA